MVDTRMDVDANQRNAINNCTITMPELYGTARSSEVWGATLCVTFNCEILLLARAIADGHLCVSSGRVRTILAAFCAVDGKQQRKY